MTSWHQTFIHNGQLKEYCWLIHIWLNKIYKNIDATKAKYRKDSVFIIPEGQFVVQPTEMRTDHIKTIVTKVRGRLKEQWQQEVNF